MHYILIYSVMATEIPSLSQANNQLSTDGVARHDLVSSQDEDILSEMPVSIHSGENARAKRFLSFLKYVYYSTITSYSFTSTTITKAVNLISSNGISQLICMPYGYVLCT